MKKIQMDLLNAFHKKYQGTVTSGDLQTYAIAMTELENALKNVPEVKGNLIQLRDDDGSELGLVITNCPPDKIQELYSEFISDSDDAGADTFADFLSEKGFEAERVFTNDVAWTPVK